MTELLKELCSFNCTSGDEGEIRDFIIEQIKDYCSLSVDALGNIIAFKQGKNRPAQKIMVDAHMDEVGLIITAYTSGGFLKFQTVGGVDTAVLIGKRVLINNKIWGVIGTKPVHLAKGEEAKKLPKADSLYIDIGASSKEQAALQVELGDFAVIPSEFSVVGDKIFSKALDDRIGCALLINLIKNFDQYDFYATFTTGEEVGCRGARVAAFSVDPESALILEGTTAADIGGVAEEKQVCCLGKGVAVSFMDRATVYNRDYYNAALKSGISCQTKRAVAGGNNSGAVHLSREGVKTIALSVPCRYIHSASSVCDKRDMESAYNLAEYMLKGIASGEIK